MKTRILTGIAMAVVGLPILIFSEYLIYPVAVGLFALIAVFEMSRVSGLSNNYAIMIPTYVLALAAPIGAYFFEGKLDKFIIIGVMALIALMLYLFGYAVIKRGAVKFAEISEHFTTTAYVVSSFTAMVLVRYIPNGVFCFALVFAASWVCDTFAYFTGMLFGKHKLIPEISPKKTIEGSIGGIVFTTLAFMLYGFIVSLFENAPTPNYIVLLILGFSLSIVSQFGDLIASLIKRERGIKDYGTIFPGHGGVLDRFDSILAVSPILLAVCVFFPPFVS